MVNKKSDNMHLNRIKAVEHIRTKHGGREIYTDGSKCDSGVGCAAITRDRMIQASLPKEASVYTAELTALLNALKLIEESVDTEFTIYTDSRSALQAINEFNPKNKTIKDIQILSHRILSNNKSIKMCWIPAHVGVKGNEEADKAAKEAVEKERMEVKMPPTDYHPTLRAQMMRKWQTRWSIEPIANKLKSIKTTVKPWARKESDRTTEVIMSRLRMGHTRITHCHLMEKPNGVPSVCRRCQVDLTVRHIMEECPLIEAHRRATIGQGKIEQVLGPEAKIGKIMNFLKRIGIYEVI